MRRLISIALCVILLTVSMTGCGKKATSRTDLDIAINQLIPSIDPQVLSDVTSGRVCSLFISTLYAYDKDRRVVPCLAESYDVSTDGLTYTFHLRDGLKWSDGSPLTAKDFVFGLRRLADPESGSGSVYMITDCCVIKNARDVTLGKMDTKELGVHARDDRTLIIELEAPCPYFIPLITSASFAPCNEKFFKSCKGEYATSPETLLSCGAYQVDRYEPLAVQVHLTKNPNYFSPDDKLPDGVNIQVVANTQQAVMCYDTESLDVTSVTGDIMSWLAGNKDLRTINVGTVRFLYFGNMDKSPVKNEHIRRALSMSVDRESIAEKVIHAGSEALNSFIPKGFYTETDGSDFSKDDHRYDDCVRFNPDAAKKEWEQGLKELGTDKVELEFAFGEGRSSIAEAMQQKWEELLPGLSIRLNQLQVKQWVSDMNKSVHDLLYAGWAPDYADPTAFFYLVKTGAHGDGGYSDPEVDKLLEKSGEKEYAMDPEKRDPMLHKIEDLLLKKTALIPLFSEQAGFMVDKRFDGFGLSPTGQAYLLEGLERRE